jgi:hypothetical protein
MTKDVWIPLLGAVLFQGIGTIMITIVPETLPVAIDDEDADHGDDLSDSGSALTDNSKAVEIPAFTKKVKLWAKSTRDSFSFVTRHTAVWALVFTFLLNKVGRQSTNFLFQYVSARYEWTLAQVSARKGVREPSIRTLTLGIV